MSPSKVNSAGGTDTLSRPWSLGTKLREGASTGFVHVCGWAAIVILIGIAAFLIQGGLRAIQENGLLSMVSGDAWRPASGNAVFGFLPAEVGSVLVTGVALLACVPVSIGIAVYLSEFAGTRVRNVSKSLIEFMSAIPSVVLGLIGTALLVGTVRNVFGLSTGLTGFTAGLMVGILCLPTIVSISEDALHAVPRELRQGALALGSTRWQATYKIVLPSAVSGIFAAVLLGMGRAIGETMVVLMLAGNSSAVPGTVFASMRTLTGTIAAEAGEVIQGGLHYSSLFAMGLVLFCITFLINVAADLVLTRQKRRWSR